jgi:hypothetical protein
MLCQKRLSSFVFPGNYYYYLCDLIWWNTRPSVGVIFCFGSRPINRQSWPKGLARRHGEHHHSSSLQFPVLPAVAEVLGSVCDVLFFVCYLHLFKAFMMGSCQGQPGGVGCSKAPPHSLPFLCTGWQERWVGLPVLLVGRNCWLSSSWSWE